MYEEVLNRLNRSQMTYDRDFDFGKVREVTGKTVTVDLLTRSGFLQEVLVLDFYFPRKDDSGLIIYVGKFGYPCFYPFFDSNRIIQGAGEVILESVTQTGDLIAPYREVTDRAKGDLLLNKSKWESQSTIEVIVQLYNDIGKQLNVDSNLLIAQAKQESTFNPHAISNAGAKGWAQFLDSTAKEVGLKNSFNVEESIVAQGKYLSILLKSSNGNLLDALGRYNGGANWKNKSQSIDYVRNVQVIWKSYK